MGLENRPVAVSNEPDHSNWITYRSTAEALKREKHLFLATAGPYGAENPHSLLAERVESLVSQEHAKWASGQEGMERKSWGNDFDSVSSDQHLAPDINSLRYGNRSLSSARITRPCSAILVPDRVVEPGHPFCCGQWMAAQPKPKVRKILDTTRN